MSIRDYRKLINVIDGTNGEVLDIVNFEELQDRSVTTTISIGELLCLRHIKKILDNEHDICLKFGYKS